MAGYDFYIKDGTVYRDAECRIPMSASRPRITYGDIVDATLHFQEGAFAEGDGIMLAIDTDMLFGQDGTSPMAEGRATATSGDVAAGTVELTVVTNTQRFYDIVNGAKTPLSAYMGIYVRRASVQDESYVQTELASGIVLVNGVVSQFTDTIVPLEPGDIYPTKDELDDAVQEAVSHLDIRQEWGKIEGTLSDQTDLNAALGNKADKSDTYTKSEVDARMSRIYRYKGTVQTYADLPSSGQEIGDVYNVETADAEHGIKAGDNVAWNGEAWDALAGEIDLSAYIPTSEKGAANGVAGLDGNGKVPVGQLQIAASNRTGIVRVADTNGIEMVNENARIARASQSEIDARSQQYKPIVPSTLDYAVRSVLPNVTTIPAATTAYSLLDASATTNNHSWQYSHAPEAASTYTFPAVTNTAVAHRIKLTLDFTTVQTYAFEDAEGAAIVPLFTPTIAAGDVYEFDCEYSTVKAQWLIWPHKQGATSDDYVMQSQVGVAGGVAGLDSSAKVSDTYLPKVDSATYSGWGLVHLQTNGSQGIKANNSGYLQTSPASTAEIDARTQERKPIVPYCLNYAVTAALTDANKIQLTDAQKASAQDTLGAYGTLHLDAAPTTATVGAFGQRAIVDSTGKAYTCTAVTNTGTEAERVYSYTWTDDINANGGDFATAPSGQYVHIGKGSVFIGNSNPNSIGVGSLSVGYNNSCEYYSLCAGQFVLLSSARQFGFGFGITLGNDDIFGVGGNNYSNSPYLFFNKSGNLYITGGHQQGITVIPPATTAYTLAEGMQSHTPDTAPTYTLPTISDATRTHDIILNVLFRGYYRYADGDSGSAYAWKAKDGAILYTDTTTITAGTTLAYSDTALTTSVGAIALYDSAKSGIAMVGSLEFEDAGGNTIAPLDGPSPSVGAEICYLCEWSALQGQWTIMPIGMGGEA